MTPLEEESLQVRTVIAVVAVLALAAGGAWWALRGEPEQASVPESAPSPSAPAGDDPSEPEPSDEESPEPAGRPVSRCVPEQATGRLRADFWGMHLNEPIGDGFPDAPITTVNLTTAGTYWNQVETAPGSYDFTRLDAIVATAEERRAQPMVVLGFTPSFHASQPESPTARATMPDLAAWRAWVTAVVERYGARLDYQIWPEPNIVSNWEDSPQQMARLTAIAGDIIHARAPQARVVAPAVALRLTSQQRWMDRFWATRIDGTPVAESVDAVALDPFPVEDAGPEDALDLICQARDILAGNEVGLPVWTNEINYGVPSGGHATDVQHYPDPQQAAYVARTYALHAALGVQRVYWLGWSSYPGLAVELARDGVTTPAGRAFGVVRDWLAEGPRPECRVHRGTHRCVAESRRQRVEILWRVRGHSSVPAPNGARRVEYLSGEGRQVRSGEPVTVTQSPVAVLGRP